MIPFGLKNIGITYQFLINKVFKHYISQIIEVYVDDMSVKIIEINWCIANPGEAFGKLR